MTDINAFQPNGATVNLSVTTSSGNVALTGVGTGANVRLYNAGTATVFVAFGTSSAAAATTSAGIPIPAGAIEIYTVGPTITYLAAITASGTATLYATTGQGV